MTIRFSKDGLDDFNYWKAHSPAKIKRIRLLLQDIARTPFSGIGKPEPLVYDLQGLWSRRIDSEHRLVYQVTDEAVFVHSCRFHYGRRK